MSINTYDIGDVITLTATFTDPNTEQVVEPTAVSCHVKNHLGEVSTLEVTNSSGVYSAELEITKGPTNLPRVKWWYAFDGTGADQASQEQYIWVRRQEVPR